MWLIQLHRLCKKLKSAVITTRSIERRRRSKKRKKKKIRKRIRKKIKNIKAPNLKKRLLLQSNRLAASLKECRFIRNKPLTRNDLC